MSDPSSSFPQHEQLLGRMVGEVMDYAILLMDRDGNIMTWNSGAQHIKGYEASEIIGKNFRFFYTEEDRKAELPDRLLEEARTQGRASHEGWRVKKDGSHFWGSVVITALRDADGSVSQFAKVTRDLTERRLADEKLAEHARQLEIKNRQLKISEARIRLQNRQLEEFAYVASHDLQEPLRKIQFYSSMLRDKASQTPELKAPAEKVIDSAERLSRLITGILEYSQLQQDHHLMKATDLNQILAEVIQDLEILIRDQKATVHCDTLPTIRAIPTQMRQLFHNLISNALKFGDMNRGVEVRIQQVTDDTTATGNLVLRIADNGSGFDLRHADRLFQLFQKGHHPRRGNGIGLAVCKRIVDNHHGSIRVESAVDQGTVFEISLPVN